METIYWPQVIGSILIVGIVLIVLGIAAIIPSVAAFFANFDGDCESEIKAFKAAVKTIKLSLLAVSAGIIICVFVPSEKQMYAIYGIGGTIDYIKSNETAKQLPDKVVVALDKYIDSPNEDKEKKDD